jgi:uncharacterized repeat protein (TIGR03803 family)
MQRFAALGSSALALLFFAIMPAASNAAAQTAVSAQASVVAPHKLQTPIANLQAKIAAQALQKSQPAAKTQSAIKGKALPHAVKPQDITLPVTVNPLYNFVPTSDGYNPIGQLIQASDGNFYGTTAYGSEGGCGEVFQLTPAGVYTSVFGFSCGAVGGFPLSGLVEASNGMLYGTTTGSGNGGGTIFQVDLQTQAVTTAYTFADSGGPTGDLIDDGQGNLYGTSTVGGTNSMGSIWSFNYGTSTFTTLYSFTGGADGGYPSGGLVLASDGNLYGTAQEGGAATAPGGYGTAFELPTSGATFNVFYTFAGSDGSGPSTDLVEGPDGNIYGTAYTGGSNGGGAFFSITPAGASSTLTVLSSFAYGTDGTNPDSGRPFLGGDGNFYITGSSGGANSTGQLMQVTTAGAITDYYDFDTTSDNNATYPYAQPFEATDGNIYGTTYGGGTSSGGIIYQAITGLTPVITLTSSSPSVGLGNSVTLTWAVTNAFSLNAQVCVAYSSDGTWTGALTGTSGTASVTPAATGTTTYSFTCGGVESASTQVTVNAVTPSTTTLTASPNPATVGQSVTLTATVTGSGATPTGSVTFSAGGNTLGNEPVNGSGVAVLTASTAGIPAGSYPVIATYSGDGTYAKSTSNTVTVQLNPNIVATTTALTAAPNPVSVGQSIALTATVTAASGTPSGKVTFSARGTTLGSASLNGSGVATFNASAVGFPPGSYAVIATYAGAGNFSGSASSPVSVTLNKAATTTSLTADPTSVTPPGDVTLTATVARSTSGAVGTPAGTVTFSAGSTIIATVAVNGSGVASYTAGTDGLPAGSYPVKAKYNGDANDVASTSAAVTVTVE